MNKLIKSWWWIIALLFLMIAIGTFSVYVFFEYSFSSKPFSYGDWANLGSFIGGILTPVSLVFAGVSLLISYQGKKDELLMLTNETKKRDLKDAILRIDTDIQRILTNEKIIITVDNKDLDYDLSEVICNPLPFFDQAIFDLGTVKERLEIDDKINEESFAKYKNFSIFFRVVINLNQLHLMCKDYDSLSEKNLQTSYYFKRYEVAIKRLQSKGYKVDSWGIEFF